MKKRMLVLLLVGCIQALYAQETGKSKKFLDDNKTILEELTSIEKKTNKFNLYLTPCGDKSTNIC